MNKELAEQLKSAGFPHSNTWEEKEYWFECENHVVPTLSELISACGENFDSFHRHSLGGKNGYEHVVSYSASSYPVSNGTNEVIVGKGSTPEEAVAALWLALQTTK